MVKDEAIDLEGLTVEPAVLLPIRRGKEPKPNPMTVPLQQTWDKGEPLSVKVPAGEALGVGAKVRKAGMKLRLGAAVQYHIVPDDPQADDVYCPESKVRDLDPGQTVRVVFQARELPKAAQSEDDGEK